MGLEGAADDEELAYERIQSRESRRRQTEQCQQSAVDRRTFGEPPIVLDLARVRPLVDHADREEQRRRNDPMVNHLKDRPFDRALVQGEDAQRDETHVADAREGDETLDVGLDQGHVRTPDDGNRGDHQHGPDEDLYGLGKYGERDPQEAIGAHLEKDSGQDHASPPSVPPYGRPEARYAPGTSAP